MNGVGQARVGNAIPLRRQPMCILQADAPYPATFRRIDARGALLDTHARLPLGSAVTLKHPKAGDLHGSVSAAAANGLEVRFACDASSAGFALAVIAWGMTQAAA